MNPSTPSQNNRRKTTQSNTTITVKESAATDDPHATERPQHGASTTKGKDPKEISNLPYYDEGFLLGAKLDEEKHETPVKIYFADAMATMQRFHYTTFQATKKGHYRTTFWSLKAVASSNDPLNSRHFSVLITHLGKIFNPTPKMDDVMVIIPRAIIHLLQDKRDPRLHEVFRHLAKSLLVAYHSSPTKERLDAALSYATAAASITCQAESLKFHHLSLGILAEVHHIRHHRKLGMNPSEELTKAITYARQAAKDSSYPDVVQHCFHLSDMFRSKYLLDGKKDLVVLNKAIRYIKIATKHEDSPEMPFYSLLHGQLLLFRYHHCHPQVPRELEKIQELDEAITFITKAKNGLEQISPNHPKLTTVYGSAGEAFRARYWTTLSDADLMEARAYYEKAMEHTSSPSAKARFANEAAKLHPKQIEDGEQKNMGNNHVKWAQGCLSNAIMLLPKYNSWMIPIDDQQFALSELCGLPAEALAITLATNKEDRLQEALQLLETSRGVIIGSSLAVKRLKETSFDKYKQLHDASMAVYAAALQPDDRPESEVVDVDDAKQRTLDSVLSDIRRLPGYHDFLLPPTKEDMEKLVKHGGAIVVVNAAETRSDAIVITSKKWKHIPLPDFKLKEIKDKITQMQDIVHNWDDSNRRDKNIMLRDILSWLWKSAVRKIFLYLVEVVNKRDTRKRKAEYPLVERIWWNGVGLLCKLPFHAAGVHGTPGTENKTLIHHFRSSYIPTIKALVHAVEASSSSKPSATKSINLSMIHMQISPGNYAELEGVQDEVTAIAHKAGKYGVHAQILNTPSKNQVKAHFTDLKLGHKVERKHIIHFSCHGVSDLSDPLDSHIVLSNTDGTKLEVKKDSPRINSFVRVQPSPAAGKGQTMPLPANLKLSVREIYDWNLNDAYLAYLGACHTANNSVEELADESLHLAGAFQMAGCRNVIGSMWLAANAECIRLSREFYERLFQTRSSSGEDLAGDVSEAYHQAVLSVWKNGYGADVIGWAPFVHYGV
ncbi:hypothetical protein D9613_001147 [Agrocybe pediades]|uniref:CHAT domain-containing protein n=1 Tax=Agrocybe pediades TaxID=84607 RepID=A0A8H4QZH7_9AGAR|nr:hypothetical protein D9613_001147 [Agrocybe pediades]